MLKQIIIGLVAPSRKTLNKQLMTTSLRVVLYDYTGHGRYAFICHINRFKSLAFVREVVKDNGRWKKTNHFVFNVSPFSINNDQLEGYLLPKLNLEELGKVIFRNIMIMLAAMIAFAVPMITLFLMK